jgi:hypothetical protein
MNVYFFDPRFLKVERFPILLEILKVRRVIDLMSPSARNGICDLHNPKLIFSRQNLDLATATKQAVYAFNEPICRGRIEKGEFITEFVSRDLYVQSSAYNPIYNLENCNDDNVLVLIEQRRKDILVCNDFSRYSLNILRKYIGEDIYKDRICFCWIDLTMNHVSIRYKGKYYSLQKEVENTDGSAHCYNPLLSYIDLKIRESYKSNDLYSFLLNDLGMQKMENYLESLFRRELYSEYNNDCIYEDESIDIESDLCDIAQNGGDWIFD